MIGIFIKRGDETEGQTHTDRRRPCKDRHTERTARDDESRDQNDVSTSTGTPKTAGNTRRETHETDPLPESPKRGWPR